MITLTKYLNQKTPKLIKQLRKQYIKKYLVKQRYNNNFYLYKNTFIRKYNYELGLIREKYQISPNLFHLIFYANDYNFDYYLKTLNTCLCIKKQNKDAKYYRDLIDFCLDELNKYNDFDKGSEIYEVIQEIEDVYIVKFKEELTKELNLKTKERKLKI